MTAFTPCMTTSGALDSLPVADGQLITVTDTGGIYVDWGGARTPLAQGAASSRLPVVSVQVEDGGILELHPSDASEVKHIKLAGAASLALSPDGDWTGVPACVVYIDFLLDVPEGGSVEFEASITPEDALEAGKRHYCIMRCQVLGAAFAAGTLYVIDTEDLATQSN